MRHILVIGATGNVGREVVSQLGPWPGVRIRALVRSPQPSCLPSEVEVMCGDLTSAETLDNCLDEIDTVFLVWNAPPSNVANSLGRIVKHAHRVVFLSSPYKTEHPFFQASQPNPVSSLHREIERLIEAAGCEWTFIRPGIFAANAITWWVPQIRTGQTVRWPYLNAATAPIDERDIAAVAVRALCDDGHAGAEYVLTGPQSLTQREQIAIIGEVLNVRLSVEEISPETAKVEMFPLIPTASVINMLLSAWSTAIDQPAFLTSTVEEITGTQALSFREWVVRYSMDFRTNFHRR